MMKQSRGIVPNIHWLLAGLLLSLGLCVGSIAEAATLSVSPGTGVYTAGGTFTARVVVNTQGQSINAADGTLKFNPSELSVVGISKGTIFNLWTAEPAFSNSAGTITFSGGNPTGYSGSNGTVISVTFRVKNAGNPKVTFSSGSVLAADGRGTNVLTSMNNGSYTVAAADVAPEAEVIEYVAPANTPGAPVVTSTTHDDPAAYHNALTAELAWDVPADVIAVRTLLDASSDSIPNKVYDTPIDNITIEDLEEGVQYFHLQFKNDEGWGRVTHYRLAVDTTAPESFTMSLPADADVTSPEQIVLLHATDTTSTITRYVVQHNGGDPFEFIDTDGAGQLLLSDLTPGQHSLIVEAFDEAGNGFISTFSFSILAFDKPQFTEYPAEVSEEVIPVFRGITRPGSVVTIRLERIGAQVQEYSVQAGDDGVFTFIPDARFTTGVYEISAVAVDQHGAQSDASETIRFAVQRPGYLQIGSLIVSVLSVIVPLIALVVLTSFALWFLLVRLRRLRGGVRRETKEALAAVEKEFGTLKSTIAAEAKTLAGTRKTKKLTKAEAQLVETLQETLAAAHRKVADEVQDVDDIVE